MPAGGETADHVAVTLTRAALYSPFLNENFISLCQRA